MKDVVIGLDIGTSSVKAAGFDHNGLLLGKANAPIVLHSPAPGWAEQEPGDWWNAVCSVLQEILKNIHPQRVAAVGLSGQCPGHVLVGTDQASIGRSIIWRDQRAVEEAAWLSQNVTPAQAVQWVGTGSLADATCPPARLLWLKKHRNQDWERAVAVLQPKDYIALRLTGKIGTDRHSAYCLVHPETGRYVPEYFKLLGLPVDKMPPVFWPTESIGRVTDTASLQVGLESGTPIIIGTIDAYCDNLAGGVVYPDTAVDVAGTSEIVSLAIEERREAEGVFPADLGGNIFLCGPTQAGGDTLHWLATCFYSEFMPEIHYDKMEAQARSAPAGCDGLVFLPYLNGERAPLWDSDARGAFIGLTFRHDRRHCTRAVYESIGFAIRHILEISEKAVGRKAQELVVCGGGSRSAFWNQIKADILQRPVRPTEVTETGCLGAAILACVGSGFYSDLKEACDRMICFRDTLTPDSSLIEVYETGYQAYRNYYSAIRPILSGAVNLRNGGK
jgi:xylulokinase